MKERKRKGGEWEEESRYRRSEEGKSEGWRGKMICLDFYCPLTSLC